MTTTATTIRKRLTTNVVVISTVAIWLLTVYTHTDILTQAGMCVCVWVHTGTKALTRRPTKILTGALCRVLSSRKGAAATASLDYAMRSLFHSYTHTRTHSRHTHTHALTQLQLCVLFRFRDRVKQNRNRNRNSQIAKLFFLATQLEIWHIKKSKAKGESVSECECERESKRMSDSCCSSFFFAVCTVESIGDILFYFLIRVFFAYKLPAANHIWA